MIKRLAGLGAVVATFAWAAMADTTGTDSEGRPVILRSNGTWTFAVQTNRLSVFPDQIGFEDVDVYEYTHLNWNNANWGQSAGLSISSNATGIPNTRRRIFIKFDHMALAGLMSPDARVVLQLKGRNLDAPNRTIAQVHRVTLPWTEGPGTLHVNAVEPPAPPGMVSWMNQPQFDGATVWATMSLDSDVGPYEADITELVRAWQAGMFPNDGLVLVGADEGVGRYIYVFASSENADRNTWPRILIANVPAAGRTDLVVNGSFETAAEGYGLTQVDGWSVTSGNVDIMADFWQGADGSHSIDMTGSPGNGRIEQVLVTEPGRQYRLNFLLAGNPICDAPRKELLVTAAGQAMSFVFDTAGRTRNDMGWQKQSWTFTAQGSLTVLSFEGVGPNENCGAVVDRITLAPR